MNSMLEHLAELNPLAALSWSGFNVYGDSRSISEVKRLMWLASVVPSLQDRIRELELS